MKYPFYLFLITVAHIGFLFGVYSLGSSGVKINTHISYGLFLFIWLAVSSIATGFAHFTIITKAYYLASRLKKIIFSVFLTLISLYLGIFFSFNTYGT
jgi:hypothetical protein